jgi:hypothetical protein
VERDHGIPINWFAPAVTRAPADSYEDFFGGFNRGARTSPSPQRLLMRPAERLDFAADAGNFLDFVKRGSCHSGPRQYPPVALLISIPQKGRAS